MLATTEGKKKKKKNHLMRLASKIFREQKQNPNCDGTKFADRRILRRAKAARGDRLLWSHYILATTQQQVGPTS